MSTIEEGVYEIWSEGFRATGEQGTALYHGSAYGKTFKEAIDKYAIAHPDFARYLNKAKTAYWGCTLYANEDDARKTFG